MTTLRHVLPVIAALLCSTGRAQASSIVYTTFGPGDTYNGLSAWVVESPLVPGFGDIDHAMGFTPTASYRLDSIRLAAGWNHGTNELDVALMTDSSGLPGILLESWVFTGLQFSDPSNDLRLTASSLVRPTLTVGARYWLVADTPDTGDGSLAWQLSDPLVIGPYAQRRTDGPWVFSFNNQSAFEIRGTLVPEPSSLILLATGITTLALRRKRQRQQPVNDKRQE